MASVAASTQPQKRQKGYRPSLEQQRGILEHVRYERNMMLGAAHLLDRFPIIPSSSNDDGALHNALHEAFLLHARNLRDFLYKREKENAIETDVLARDFSADPREWLTRRPTSPLLKTGPGGLNDQAGKYLAHLSYARVGSSPNPPDWPYAKIGAAINKALDMWEELAKAEQPYLDWAMFDS